MSSAQANDAGNYFDSWVNVYATSNNSMSPSSYTISLNNFSNSSCTYSWYAINETQWDNILRSNIQSVETSSAFSQHQTEQNIIHECIENNSVISNKESYTFDMNIPSTGKYFVCVIKNSQNTWYSKPVLLYSNNSTNSNNQPTPTNNLNISSYSLKLASKNSTVNSNGSVQINANQGEKVTFVLELQNQNDQNLTFSDFNKTKYFVQYVFTNENTGTKITSTKLDLNQVSSWTYSINSSGYWTVSVNVYNQNNNEISINNNASNYQIVSQYVTINWESEEIKYQGSGTIQINNGTCYYTEANYQWQVSDNNGKSWSNLDNGSGQITNPLSLMNNTNYNIEKESNNTLYRLEIINTKNPSEYFYSNSLSPNDSLVSANISFANNTYNLEQENSATYGAFISNDNDVDLVLSLSQFGKNTTNNELLKKLSVSYTLTNWYNKKTAAANWYNQQTNNTSSYLGVLSTFYNEKSNEIIISIPFSVFVDYEQQSITNYNNTFGTNSTQYKPITLSLTIDQNGNPISTNSLVVSPEIANIALTSTKQFSKVNSTYYCKYGQNVTLNSSNSILNFPSTIMYQWQYSSNGTSNWKDVNNGTNSSLTTNIEGNIYYRLDVGETAMGCVNIYSNIIHFDSSIPTATISFSSSNDYNDEVVTNFTQSFDFNADIVQNNEAINSNPNIKIMYQYQINNGTWIDAYTNALLLSPNNVFYQYACNQTGIVNIRLKLIYNTIVQYSNTLTLYNIDPGIQTLNNLNIVNPNNTANFNNYISNSDSTYTFNYGSNVVLSLYNPAFNLSAVNQSYSIYQIQWFEKGNTTALATYNVSENDGEILDYPICVTKNATYYAEVTYTPTNGGTNVTSTSTPIIINSTNTNNQYVANITLNNASQLNSKSGSTTPLANEYYFLNSYLLSNQITNMQENNDEGSWSTFPSFNLNLYYDGQELNNASSNIKSGNWKVNWYISLFNSSTNKWTQLKLFNSIYTGSWINSLNSQDYGPFSYWSSNGNLINKSCWSLNNFLPLTPNWETITGYSSFPSSIDSIPESDITNMRICALITAPTTSFYTNFYYLNIPTSLTISNNY